MLRGYEMMVVVTPQVAEDELTGALDQVSGYIANAGGSVAEVLKDNAWVLLLGPAAWILL